MASEPELERELLIQPLEPGTSIPDDFPKDGLFLLNFSTVLNDDVWDDYGNKELDQAGRLRGLASRIIAIADAMEKLGYELKSYPDADDYEMGDYKQTWEEVCEEMQSTFDGGYSDLGDLVEELADAAIGDFMD